MADLTKDEFIDGYMKAANIDPAFRTPDGFQRPSSQGQLLGKIALRCYCGHDICRGWAMIRNDPDDIAHHKEFTGNPAYIS